METKSNMRKERSGAVQRWLLSLVVAGVTGAAGAQKVNPDDYQGAIKANDLFIVDCLLPPQVRQMGRNFTYLAARQPIRTSAKDCAIRGGEYVAYDRANLKTALAVWLPAAEGGDAQAQTYVGEMYEEGMGVAPDYVQAAKWYALAAEQGHPRAQINLGAMYESGRGVSKDMTQAMNLYREASGITDGVLEYTTDEQMARRRALAQEAEQLRAQVLDLTDQLDGAEKALTRRKRDLRRARDELARTLDELSTQRTQAAGISAAEREALERLEAENQQLRSDLQKTQTARSVLLAELGEAQEKSENAQLELSQVRGELDQREAAVDQSQAEIERLREQLRTAQNGGTGNADELAAAIADKEAALDTERDLIAARQQELAEALDAAEQQLAQSRNRENDLRAQVSGQAEEIELIRGSLSTAQDELMESQLRIAAGQGDAEELEELRLEIAEREQEIAAAQAQSDAILDELLVQQVAASEEIISMISPEVGVARGVKAVTLFADVENYDLIGRVSPRSELLAFRVNDRSALDLIDENGLFKVPVSLAGMETPVSIEAVTADGSRTRESFVIQKDLPQALAQRATSRQFRKRLRRDLGNFHALVIGNNNYDNHETLKTASADAQGVADVLRSRYGFNVSLLQNASQVEMVQEFARLTEELDKNDNLLIYYAGHGVITPDGNGHWLGVDSSANADESWIGNNQVSDFISEMNAKHVLVVADSCYSGTLSGAAIRPIPLEVDDQDLLFISRVRARTVLTSGGLQPVLDDGGDGNSIFGGAFIRAISGNADVMEGYRLFETVEREVETRSRLAQLRQSPEYTAMKFAGHEGSEFFFLPESDTASGLSPIRL